MSLGTSKHMLNGICGAAMKREVVTHKQEVAALCCEDDLHHSHPEEHRRVTYLQSDKRIQGKGWKAQMLLCYIRSFQTSWLSILVF